MLRCCFQSGVNLNWVIKQKMSHICKQCSVTHRPRNAIQSYFFYFFRLCLSHCLSHSVFDDACACETETWEGLADGHRVRKASDKWSRPFEQMTEHKSWGCGQILIEVCVWQKTSDDCSDCRLSDCLKEKRSSGSVLSRRCQLQIIAGPLFSRWMKEKKNNVLRR